MTTAAERDTQNRVVALFRDTLAYTHLGDWRDRANNSNVEPELLAAFLRKSGYSEGHITKAVYDFQTEARNLNRSLYDNNKRIYQLLRYGVHVRLGVAENTETVWLIDWEHPEKNDFAIAEEVTLKGPLERRPDLVLYVNGIAIAVIELKNGRVSIGDGIRQLISNQSAEFNAWFFSTVQLVFAGNDSEGLQYGSIGTEEKMFLRWKEDQSDNADLKLDKYLQKMCRKERLLELIHDYVLFDGGKKKLPRVHQYFGIKAAQEYVRRREGGIIWHTQGSGKSIVMVLLAKWILENQSAARVVIVTDRDELDKQIEGVFLDAGEPIKRTTSGQDLMTQLGQPLPRLLCSLVHKFGRRDVDNFDAFLAELEAQPCQSVGDLFVFVDECHRTQSGRLHRTMKALMPRAVFIGFTGTPLLKADKAMSQEVFGRYIHTYKFSEAVADEVVLDLVYEARDIDQQLSSPERVNEWFDAKTRGLNDWQKAELRKQWGTMQTVLSSRSRMERVVMDILHDFGIQRRLSDHRGNAILVASSIYEAVRYYELFQKTLFKGHCAVVTSYNPQAQDVTKEDTGANTETDKQFVYNTYVALLKDVNAGPSKSKTEVYEDEVKALFKTQPARMRLLIVVDKLLTGFDAPSCTYLYIDKSMQDHGLFQAICRTNRLDGADKDYGHIVDYKDLFKKVENAISVYADTDLDESEGGASSNVLLQDRLTKGRERLDDALEGVALICEPVEPPRTEREYIRYFCGNTEVPSDLMEREPQRVGFYKAAVALLRAYANIADDLEAAGYSAADISRIKTELDVCVKIREVIRRGSGETIDLKTYEADMRHLIDTYIEADAPRKISTFDNMPLLEIIVQSGLGAAVSSLPEGIRSNETAVAETIINNVRKRIIKEHLNDPAYYDRMSVLLEGIIADLKAKRLDYKQYLLQIADLAKQVQQGKADTDPLRDQSAGVRAIFNNMRATEDGTSRVAEQPPESPESVQERVTLALAIDHAVKQTRPDGWRENVVKERVVKNAIKKVLNDATEAERIFQIIKQQREY